MKNIYQLFLFFSSVGFLFSGENLSTKGDESLSKSDENNKKNQEKITIMNLKEALSGSYDHDLNKAAREQVYAEHERIVQAKADFLPTLTLQGQYQDSAAKNSGENIQYPAPNTRSQSANLVLSQNLSRGGASFCKMDEADARIKKAWCDLSKTEQSTFKDAANSFFDVFAAIKAVNVAKANLDFLQKQFESTSEKHKVGEETITNVKATEADFYKGKADYDASIATLESLKEDFQYKTTIKAPNEFGKPIVANFLPKELGIAQDIALNNHYAIKSAQYDVDVAQAQAGQVKGSFFPKVDLELKGSKQNSDIWGDLGLYRPGVTNTDNMQVTLNASVPIYEAGSNRSQLRQAYKQKTAAIITLTKTKKEILSAVKSAWINLRSLENQATALEKVVMASERAVDGLIEEQKAGTKTILDVLQEQRKYFNYRKQLVDAEKDYFKACVNLLFTMGVLNTKKLDLQIVEFDPSKDYEDAKGRF